MADVNEEIISQYLKVVKKWFYATDISFKVIRGNSNIDILAFDPLNNKYYDIEVKFRSAYTISANPKETTDTSKNSVSWFTRQFSIYPERELKIKEFTNKQKPIKVLVTTKQLFGKSKNKQQQLEILFKREMSKNGFKNSEIWYFDDIIKELYDSIDLKGRYNTELLQTIRMIKTYKP